MDTRLGTFVVIEGTGTSGKTAQCDLLVRRLIAEGHHVLLLDFPQYNQDSSYFVREYLDGKYGTPDSVSPYTASLFYALDRYQAAAAIRAALDAGKVVVANRFTGSSMAQQGVKFNHPEERRGFFIWLDNLEFQMLGMPRPDKSIVLRAQPEKDNPTPETTEVYDDMCNLFPRDFYRIDCVRSGKQLSANVIQDAVWNAVEPLLSPANGKQGSLERYTNDSATQQDAQEPIRFYSGNTYGHFVPPSINKDLVITYSQSIDKIAQLHAKMLPKLVAYLSTISQTPKPERNATWETNIAEQAIDILDSVLPVAIAAQNHESIVSSDLKPHIGKNLPMKGHSDDYNEPVRLAKFSPRNELDLVSDLLFQSSQLSADEVAQSVASFTYAQKEQVLLAGLTDIVQSDAATLPEILYTWDLLTSTKAQLVLTSHISGQITKQALSPRYGYEMPITIEDAGLAEEFEECFDLSLELHSLLQSKGYEFEAQYATLLGHKTRWKLSYGLQGTLDLKELRSSHELVEEMLEKVTEVHPLISQAVLLVQGENTSS